MHRIFVLVSLLSLALASQAHAANLLVNPDFDTDLSGWNVGNGPQGDAVFDGTDGSPAPGSVLFTGSACCTVEVSQCVAAVAGQSYDFGASLIEGPTAPGQSGDGTGVEVYWYPTVDCSTNYLSNSVLQPTVTTSWARYAQSLVVAPAGTQSAMYRIRQYNFAGLPNLTSHGDSAFFGPSGTVPVELQSWKVD